IEAEQRQFEAVLPTGLAVTASGVAAELAQQRDDLSLEINRPGLAKAADLDIDARSGGAAPDHDLRGAVAGRGDVAVLVNASNFRVAAGVARRSCEIASAA